MSEASWTVVDKPRDRQFSYFDTPEIRQWKREIRRERIAAALMSDANAFEFAQYRVAVSALNHTILYGQGTFDIERGARRVMHIFNRLKRLRELVGEK